MSTNQALFPIASMARVLGVSTAGYTLGVTARHPPRRELTRTF